MLKLIVLLFIFEGLILGLIGLDEHKIVYPDF
jgi:hypothetical protein